MPTSDDAQLHEVLSLIGHDLRTPLAAVSGLATKVSELHADALPPEVARDLRLIADESRRAAVLAADLVSLARAQSQPLRRQEVDLDAAMALVFERLGDRARRLGASVRWDHLGRCYADPAAVRQVLQNLVGNALDHAGGRPPRIGIVAEHSPGEVRVHVDDAGPGIPPDEREDALQPFHRGTEAAPGGSGLGLAIVAGLVARHGGKLTLGDAASGGLRASFTLPQRPPERR